MNVPEGGGCPALKNLLSGGLRKIKPEGGKNRMRNGSEYYGYYTQVKIQP